MKNEQLVVDNMKLVYSIINKNYPTFSFNDDVIQTGMLGLCKAADTWDESKSKFTTYATYCILNHIKNYFRSESKHQGISSLDFTVKGDDGCEMPMYELIVGELDIDLEGVTWNLFYESLSENEKEFVDDCMIYKRYELAEKYGVCIPVIRKRINNIKHKWRKFNEEKGSNSN